MSQRDFWFKCAPGGADQSLQVSRFSLKRKNSFLKNEAHWHNWPKMTKICYALNAKVA